MYTTQVKKISEFTEKLVKQLRAQTKALQAKVTNDKDHQHNNDLMQVTCSFCCWDECVVLSDWPSISKASSI